MDGQITTTERAATVHAIQEFQRELAKCPQEEVPLIHTFAPGQYARSCFLKANMVAVGKIHKHAHIMIMSAGDIAIETENGFERIQGFHVFTSPAGIKRIVQTFADTILTTVHVTELTEVAAIESEMTVSEDNPFAALECAP
jgi:hypothetical protein